MKNWKYLALAGALGLLGEQSYALDLRADVNRDGALTAADDSAEDQWTWQRGAVFLYNCDDDNDDGIVDSIDGAINGAPDQQDLSLLRLAPLPGVSAGDRVVLAADSSSANLIRLYYLNGQGTPVLLPSNGELPAAQLAAGIDVLIEGRSFATQSWNGRTLLTVTHSNSGGTTLATDAVRLRVAPFLLMHNGLAVTELYARAYPTRNDTFISQLTTHSSASGVTFRVVPGGNPYPANQIWLQDTQEVGYTAAPGRWMNVVLRGNRNRELDRWAERELLAPDYGWFVCGSYRSTYANGNPPNGWLDWYGNLEVTPPLPNWMHGRVYYGVNGSVGLNPEIVNMLAAQELQGPPFALDTGWLLIKHVDEMIAFVPTGDAARPWRVLVPDTSRMLALLDRLISEGRGGLPIFTTYESGITVSGLRNNSTNVSFNATLQSTRINPMIEVFKTGTGITEADIVRVPAWYNDGGSSGADSQMPNMVNLLVMNGKLVVSDPNGPLVGGVDQVQAEFRSLLAGTDLEVHFVDDRQYQRWSGNVHCGTNARRTPSGSVWDLLTAPATTGSSFLLY